MKEEEGHVPLNFQWLEGARICAELETEKTRRRKIATEGIWPKPHLTWCHGLMVYWICFNSGVWRRRSKRQEIKTATLQRQGQNYSTRLWTPLMTWAINWHAFEAPSVNILSCFSQRNGSSVLFRKQSRRSQPPQRNVCNNDQKARTQAAENMKRRKMFVSRFRKAWLCSNIPASLKC